ncbi:MAG: hypothetical protein MAG451_01862 [Anaerolineales bacterium]|nr:hypothetical protein [Anaerolineales bacterium]
MTLIHGDKCPHCGNREWKDVTEEQRTQTHELWTDGLIPRIYHSNVQSNYHYECQNCHRIRGISSPMQEPE